MFVSLYNCLLIVSGSTPLLSSITILIPSLFDSSLISLIPSIFLSLANKAIFSFKIDLLTWYGIDFIIKIDLPFFFSSNSISPLILNEPLLYYNLV